MRIVSFIALRTLLAGSVLKQAATAVIPRQELKGFTGRRGLLQLECPNREFIFRSPHRIPGRAITETTR